MNKNFVALLEEGQFTFQILGNGVTQIGKANYAQKGYYFSSFTSLSTGLERLGKLCVIVDYYLKNDCQFPCEGKYFRKIGHDLESLYQISRNIVNDNNVKFEYLDNLNSNIHSKTLYVLTKFANGDRYSNLNFITNNNWSFDPIKEWFEKIDQELFDTRVSIRKKEKINNDSEMADLLLGSVSSVRFINESGKEISSMKESSFLTGMLESVSKYRRLIVLQIIRYWVEILTDLQYQAMAQRKNDIPFFSEIFSLFRNDDAYFLTRKTYNKYY